MPDLIDKLKSYQSLLKEPAVVELADFKGNLEGEIQRYLI